MASEVRPGQKCESDELTEEMVSGAVPDISVDTPPDQAQSQLSAAVGRPLPDNFGLVTVFESGIVVAIGAAAGLALATVASSAIVAVSPVHLPVATHIGIDPTLMDNSDVSKAENPFRMPRSMFLQRIARNL